MGEQACRLTTVVGAAGVGKSRLVKEFLADRADDALVVRGRCLPYGEGISFWPIKEAVSEAAGLSADVTPQAARERIRSQLVAEPDADLIVERVAEVVGLAEAAIEHRAHWWAIGRLFESLAARRPLVAVFDDIQWAEACAHRRGGRGQSALRRGAGGDADRGRPTPTPRRFLGRRRRRGRNSRPADDSGAARRPHRTARRQGASGARARLSRGQGLPPRCRARAVAASRAERRRRLPGGARAQGPAQTESTSFADEEAYRFRHQLLRDAAYESLPKEGRSQLHERFAGWLEQKVGAREGEYEEILGYHLERAYRYRVELGLAGDGGLRLADSAAKRLGSAGLRARARGDLPAAANLLSRAIDLTPPDSGARQDFTAKLRDVLFASGELKRARMSWASVRCFWRWRSAIGG